MNKYPFLFFLLFFLLISLPGYSQVGSVPTLSGQMQQRFRELTPAQQRAIQEELAKSGGVLTPEVIEALRARPEFQGLTLEEIRNLAPTHLVKPVSKPTPAQQRAIQEELAKSGGVLTPEAIEALRNRPEFQGLTLEEIRSLAQAYTATLGPQAFLPEKKIESLFRKYLEKKGAKSPLEVSLKLKPFGYEIFKRPPLKMPPVQPVPPDYIIGPGDEIGVILWGRVNVSYTLIVNPDGTILFPQIGPLVVAGMRYDEMRSFLKKQAERIVGANAAVTIGKLHTIQVFVLGEAEHPGVYELSAMSTILDALIAAGGSKETGSLRKILLKRENKLIAPLDLYDLLLKGDKTNNKYLKHGDVIFIPTVGPLVGIGGNVKRPAIYELKGEKTLEEAIKLAGGLLPTAYVSKIQVERIKNNQKKVVLDIDATNKEVLKGFKLKDGDLVKVFSIVKEDTNAVYLYGNVRHPGRYAYKQGMKIGDIIKSTKDLLPDTLMDFAIIKRLTPPDNHWEYKSFSLKKLLLEHSEKENIKIKPYDIILVANKWDVMPKKMVEIEGAVNKPGKYEYLSNMKVADLIKLAGGFKPYAYLYEAELTRNIPISKGMKTEIIKINLKKALAGDPNENIPLMENDYLFVKNVPEWKKLAVVDISGEVLFPGRYVIKKGERLSSVLKRAGGFTDKAYLKGAVFTRKRVQELQQRQINEMIDRLESELMVGGIAETGAAITPEQAKISAEEAKMKREFLARLRKVKAKGRLVIHLKPLEEFKGTPDDIELEDGDKLYIPPNPQTIQVVGAVYNPTAFIYKPGKDISYYINKAGGYTKTADKKQLYVLKIDGTGIRPGSWYPKAFWWEPRHRTMLAPGDTIVVPEKLEKIAWMRNIKDITTILYQIAVGAGVIVAAY